MRTVMKQIHRQAMVATMGLMTGPRLKGPLAQALELTSQIEMGMPSAQQGAASALSCRMAWFSRRQQGGCSRLYNQSLLAWHIRLHCDRHS